MSSAVKTPIKARIAVQPFVGYHLWGVALRGNPKQQWKDSAKTYGRTDTLDQGWGMVSELVNDLPLEAIREDATQFSWKFVRDALWMAGEAKRHEGSKVWSIVSFERRNEYARLGVAFHEKIKFAESERQRINRERDRAYYSQFSSVTNNALPSQHLKVLGLPAYTSNIDEIKTAYRKLAGIHHPDRGGNPKEFIKVRQAYESLIACV